MKNKTIKLITLIFFALFTKEINANEQFNFDVTEIEITENGNVIKGLKRGTITSKDDGFEIQSDTFEYNKILNLFIANGNVIANNKEGLKITSNYLEYNKKFETITIKEKVVIEDKVENIKILSEKILYKKNDETFFSEGKTKAKISSKYDFESEDVTYDKKAEVLISDNLSIIEDNNNRLIKLDNFRYSITDEILKGKNINITDDTKKIYSDKFNFAEGIINLNSNEFLSTDTKIYVAKDIFDNTKNDPRLYGVSSKGDNNKTIVNKGVFTSCQKNEDCTPWSIKAEKITHDKQNKEMVYDNAILKIYDVPVAYFPKFFHPDPTVKRQSGFLKPQFNNSNNLGSSFYLPYFKVLDVNKDLTFKPTIYDDNKTSLQTEYRQITKNSYLESDVGLVSKYKSSTTAKTKSIGHLFAQFNYDFNFPDYDLSELQINIEKVSNDTYLKVFDTDLSNVNLKPSEKNKTKNEIKYTLSNSDFNLTSGFSAYETLSGTNSDRYQYVFPYYNFSKTISAEKLNGNFDLFSSGDNKLSNTNNLSSRIINDINYKSFDWISNYGIKNNFNAYFKNVNRSAKNDTIYTNSLQVDGKSLFEMASSLPLTKSSNKTKDILTPKLSLRLSESGMINSTSKERLITTENIFNINRLGLNDTLEAGKSLTLGVDYKKSKIKDVNKYFEFKLAKLFRDKHEQSIPTSSSLDKKNSNLFGRFKNNFNKNFNLSYDFSVNENMKNFEYNSLNTNLSIKKLSTEFNFIEKNGLIGSTNTLENKTSYNFNDSNFLKFTTRRNRKINLTEYYDLVYEYKNDCLTAGIKYKKTYYADRDLKPNEDLLFTVTIIPLSTFEQKVDQ
ncbi:LPS-assembly protein LptD [Candidatus Pelagibacter sp.]|uniref:LPS-assembly protein LptD n=1 Tax=Candidatus Pelagibacter sp. TaxID=2024849 RepID=UPI003F864DFA